MTTFTGTVFAGTISLAAAVLGATALRAQSQTVKNILLVHGAFADGTSWGKVIPILEARGFHAVAVQNPLTSLEDDVNATRRLIALQDGPVILVGHSWGGAGIINAFADGLPMAERRLVLAVQGQIYGPMFDEKLTHAAWKSKPSWHVISTKDHTLQPAMEEDGAKRSGGVAVRLPTCHVAMLQEPEKVADVITAAAKESV